MIASPKMPTRTAPKTAVVTGASSGIGKAAAIALAQQGWRIIGTGRDPGRIAASEAELRAVSGGRAPIDILRADLSVMREAAQLAETIQKMTPRIDVLLNNAGGMTDSLKLTSEGLEESFAANHLGPFLLTQRLLPLLQATARNAEKGSVRIIFTSSGASESAQQINFDDIQNLAAFSPGKTYCSVKLANVLVTRELAQRVARSGIVVHAAAPGPVASRFFDYAPQETRDHVSDLPMMTEAEGADTLIWLATDPEAGRSTGGYWQGRKQRTPHPQANERDVLARFWAESENLIAQVIV